MRHGVHISNILDLAHFANHVWRTKIFHTLAGPPFLRNAGLGPFPSHRVNSLSSAICEAKFGDSFVHDYFAHAGAVDPVSKVHGIPISIVVRELLPKAGNKEVGPAIIGKVVSFPSAPKICDPTKKRPLKFVNTPKWLDANDLTVGQPSARLSQASLWIGGLPYF
jgi:hypothetical protein